MHVEFPLQFDHRGRTAESDPATHVREMLELLLFTTPNERVNRPEFGCGLVQTAFSGNGDQLSAALQASIQASINRWLGDVLDLQALEVQSDDAMLHVELRYVVLQTGETRTDTLRRRAPA